MAKDKHDGESRQHYRLCVPPCPHYIRGGDTHSLCVVCLGAKCTELAFEVADCPHCKLLSIHMLHSRKSLFEEGVFACVPRGTGLSSAEAEWWLRS